MRIRRTFAVTDTPNDSGDDCTDNQRAPAVSEEGWHNRGVGKGKHSTPDGVGSDANPAERYQHEIRQEQQRSNSQKASDP